MNSQAPMHKLGDWATVHVEALQRGEIVQFRPTGKSMEPIIPSKALVTVAPHDGGVDERSVVLVTCRDNTYLHRIGAMVVIGMKQWFRIENASGRSNGWVTLDQIHGRVVRVEP